MDYRRCKISRPFYYWYTYLLIWYHACTPSYSSVNLCTEPCIFYSGIRVPPTRSSLCYIHITYSTYWNPAKFGSMDKGLNQTKIIPQGRIICEQYIQLFTKYPHPPNCTPAICRLADRLCTTRVYGCTIYNIQLSDNVLSWCRDCGLAKV